MTSHELSLAIAAAALVLAAGLLVMLTALLGRSNRRLALHATRMLNRRRQQRQRSLDQRATDKASGERYFRHMRRAPAPVIISTPDGELIAANDAMLRMLGYDTEDELRSLGPGALFLDPDDADLRTRLQLGARDYLRNGELRLRCKDGDRVDALVNLRVIRHETRGELYEVVATDVTELRDAMEANRRLEQQLHHAQKLEAMGQLAAGIAHEINTPIQYVGDNVHFLRDACRDLMGVLDSYRGVLQSADKAARDRLETLMDRIDAKAALPELINDVQKALEGSFEGISRVAEIVKAMKDFAHPGVGECAPADLNAVLNTSLVMARNEYKTIAEVKLELGDIPPVWCRRGDINKVLLNMIVNASHAIDSVVSKQGGRGTIAVSTRQIEDRVQITIADTGCGIPLELQARIYEPFFTTKAVGKGTGQGLAIARGIVESHGGRIHLLSAPGSGTIFTIELPIAGSNSGEQPTGIAA